MYKKLSFEEIMSIKSTFLGNIKKLYTNRWFTYFKAFIKSLTQDEVEEIMFMQGTDIAYRIKFGDTIVLIDERENIQLELDEDTINKVHNQLKKQTDYKGKRNLWNELLEKFNGQDMKKYLGKHFLVYDIETIGNLADLDNMKFMVAYSINSADYEEENPPKYKFISPENLDKFVNYLLDFDGYIVWYNNIAFDNPVIITNSTIVDKKEALEKINEKSLDLFLVFSSVLKRRQWLNAIASSIVWISKTLSVGDEWMKLMKLYNETGDKKALAKIKRYCKNDVKMTITLMLYLIFNGKIRFDGKDYHITTEKMISAWNRIIREEAPIQNNTLL